MLYAFFWVIPWHLNFICQHFGTLRLFHLHRHVRTKKIFSWLHKTQHPTTKTSKETVVNLSGQTLDDGVTSLLQNGLNHAVTPCTISIEVILAEVEKAMQSLPVEMTEARQETVRIIKKLQTQRQLNES